MAIPQHDTPVPQHTLNSIRNYVLDGQRPGGFLMAFLTHDFEAVLREADPDHGKRLIEMYEVMYNMAPAGCHGSPKIVSDWMDHDGVQKNYEQFEELFDGYEQEHYTPDMAV